MAYRVEIDMALLIKCLDEGYSGPRLADKFGCTIGCIKDRLDALAPEYRAILAKNGKAARGWTGHVNIDRRWK
jgi:hypothetical protein